MKLTSKKDFTANRTDYYTVFDDGVEIGFYSRRRGVDPVEFAFFFDCDSIVYDSPTFASKKELFDHLNTLQLCMVAR